MRRALFYPDKLVTYSKIYGILKLLRLRPTNNIRDGKIDLIFLWDTKIKCSVPPELVERAAERNLTIWNSQCLDVSKQNVDKIFSDVFGYSSLVNPFFHKGYCVKKTHRQGTHDGIIIKCPILSKEKNFIYQKLLDNRVNNTEIDDIRLSILNGEIVHGFIKRKPIYNPFKSSEIKTWSVCPFNLFSSDEINKILEFSKRAGIDFADIDIIRNNSDGKIYILDINNIAGASYFLDLKDIDQVYSHLAKKFKEKFL